MTNREEGILALALASDGNSWATTESYTDVSQSDLRSPHRHGLLPRILPNSRQRMAYRQRIILGYESYLIQGLSKVALASHDGEVQSTEQVLAGSCWTCIQCWCPHARVEGFDSRG